MSTVLPLPSEPVDAATLQMVLASGARPYIDLALEPRLRRPCDGSEELPPQIRSPQVTSWVAKVYHANTGKLIGRGAIDRVLLVLEGMAEELPQRTGQLCDVIEQDPVLRMLIRLVRMQLRLTVTATDLLRALTEHAVNEPHVVRSAKWPRSPARLGRRLRSLKSWLEEANISLEFNAQKEHRWITLAVKNGDSNNGSDNLPSPVLSPSNIEIHRDASSSDGSDGSDANRVDPEIEFQHIVKKGTL